MPGRRVDTEKAEGISVECLDDALLRVAVPEVDWNRVRRTAPLNILLPSTVLWASDLPPRVRPMALMAAFPRIANLLAANWKEPAAFHNYMRSLLFDRRGDRQGFSPRIKKELVRLRTAYHLGSTQRASDVDREGSPNPALAPPPSSHGATR
jgi:hypothetical protein